MKRINLDFSERSANGRWLGVGFLILAALATAKLVEVYVASKNEGDILERRIARLERQVKGMPEPQSLSEGTRLEIRRANEIVDQITVPWDRLFAAIEGATSNKVALMGVTPDPKVGTVEISAESTDLQAMFDYVKRLERQSSLKHVYLLNHQVSVRDPNRPVRFKVTAAWLPAPSRI